MNDTPAPPSPAGRDAAPQWHAITAAAAAAALDVDPERGLAEAEAERRRREHGPNEVAETEERSVAMLLLRQFLDVLTGVLVIAAALSLAVGETTDAAVIFAIILLNGAFGFAQEWRAEKALAALKAMLTPSARVIRDGRMREISARDVVPGDLLTIETGDQAPADLRLLAATDLRMDESMLTGESEPVAKSVNAAPADAPVAERRSMALMGAAAVNGRGRGVVVATGMRTEFGRIAALTKSADGGEATPLKRQLAHLARRLGALAVILTLLVVALGLLTDKSLFDMFMTGVALAVAAVPEGLPAVVTITLALGVNAMAKRRALLRRLQAAETLGAATVICTDKTGTITQNEMTTRVVWTFDAEAEIEGVGYEPHGAFMEDGAPIDPAARPALAALLRAGAVCNHAQVVESDGATSRIGEPTEAAILVAAMKAGIDGDAEVIGEISFSSERKRMTIVERLADGSATAHVKGAPDVLAPRLSHVLDGETRREITDADRARVEAACAAMLQRGFRVLAAARRASPAAHEPIDEAIEQHLEFLGLFGIFDPPRPEAADAIAMARSAGVKVVMITGDAGATARSIARSVGLPAERAVLGPEIDALSDAELAALIDAGALFARTAPDHKMRMVRLLQARGDVVAMTGDGVNDAPALKAADVGVAMGRRGSDVAKGASDIVLTDDNFASIVLAVEEGRRQFDNIRKFVRYLLSSNWGEVVAICVAIMVGGPLILLPAQILWMNLVTDGATALALGLEPGEKDAMRRRPRPISEPILDRAGVAAVLLYGGYLGLAAFALFLWRLPEDWRAASEADIAAAQTLAFTALVVFEKVNVFNFKSLTRPVTFAAILDNRWLLIAVGGTLLAQIAAVYLPFMQQLLHTVPLGWADWGVILLLAAPLVIAPQIVFRSRFAASPRPLEF